MAITIWYYELWAESQGIRVAANALAAATPNFQYVEQRVDMEAGDNKKPPFKGLGPNNEPPVLEDPAGAHAHAQINWDAIGIARYLDNLLQGTLLPPNPCNMPLSWQWLGWNHTYLSEPMNRIVRECLQAPKGQRDVAALDAAYKRLTNLVGDLEARLPAQGFINWDYLHQPPDQGIYSLADMQVASVLRLSQEIPPQNFSLANFPKTTAYLALVAGQPSFDAVWNGFVMPQGVGDLGH